MLNEQGFELIKNFMPSETISEIIQELATTHANNVNLRSADTKLESVKQFLKHPKLQRLVQPTLGSEVQFVRAILFQKSSRHNWGVNWHQDKTVCVSEYFQAEGWGPWSTKDDKQHVQVPQEVLNNMLTVRIHLDRADTLNGCLYLVPNSHKNGIINEHDIDTETLNQRGVACEADAGDVLVMRPHIFHCSKKSQSNTPRRVLHLEFCNYPLPPGIKWG